MELKEYEIAANGIFLHAAELGDGPAVLFCHGFPDTSYTWRQQLKAVASAGYRAIAPDMRGYGHSSAPADPALYTPLHTAGDLIGLLDALNISSAVIVGHDWGATHAWNAAMMRPDRFTAVFCLSVPYFPRGDVSVFERMRTTSGHENDFYMFEQMKPEADQMWADAAVTIPGILYWASGSAPADLRWSPLDPTRSLYRPAPGPLPSWVESAGLPCLIGNLELDNVGHWIQHEASAEVSEQLVKFLRTVNPASGAHDGNIQLSH